MYAYVHNNLVFKSEKYVKTQVSIKRLLAKSTLIHTCSEILYCQLKNGTDVHSVFEKVCKINCQEGEFFLGVEVFERELSLPTLCNSRK